MLYLGRIYNEVTLDISTDNINWINIYDSEKDGRYKETGTFSATQGGRTFYLNNDTMSMHTESKVLYVGGLDTK